MHTYDLPTQRNTSAGPGFGSWLRPALMQFEIPESDWPVIASAVLARVGLMSKGIAADPSKGIRIVDTQGTLTPALTTDTGPTHDWQNEIHPTRAAYIALAAKWEQVLTAVFIDRTG